MKKLLIVIGFISLIAASPTAYANINIFACAPEWGALADEIGGKYVRVYTASHAFQNVHRIRVRPSLIAEMKKADLVICSGASLEVSWLPSLLQKAGKESVQMGGIGHLMAADYIDILEFSEPESHAGHSHPDGNPHVHLNPNNIPNVAEVLANRLSVLDEENHIDYRASFNRFNNAWSKRITQWEKEAQPLSNNNYVVYHDSWIYLFKWLGLNVITSLEPQAGIPPNAAHLERVLASIKDKDVSGILVAPYENDKPAQWLSEKSGLPIIRLPFTVRGNDKATDLYLLFDNTIAQLKQADKTDR